MAKKKAAETEAAADEQAEAVAAAQAEFDASAATHNEIKAALDEAAVDLEEKRAALDSILNPPAEPITGPRIKIEDGVFVAVAESDLRQPRLLLFGKNYEHVSETRDQDEEVWVYRQM